MNTAISTCVAEKMAMGICHELEAYINPEKQAFFPRFFKTGKGEYGEGDRFLGVVVPDIRRVARLHKDEPMQVVDVLLQSPWHECRLCALLMLVEHFKKCGETQRKDIYEFYLGHTARVNNWDLVDLSAPYIVGEYLKDKPRNALYRLSGSPLLWEQRIAVVATLTLIRSNQYNDTLRLAERLLHHPHDLIHKAVGWMLREVGKRDKTLLVSFIEAHAACMPRTMLRYAIEKFSKDERQAFLMIGKLQISKSTSL